MNYGKKSTHTRITFYFYFESCSSGPMQEDQLEKQGKGQGKGDSV
jgi:hypothetical protein